MHMKGVRAPPPHPPTLKALPVGGVEGCFGDGGRAANRIPTTQSRACGSARGGGGGGAA